MDEDAFKKLVGRLVRYLANTLLFITIFVFISGLAIKGVDMYSDQLLWIQLNSMWTVVVLLILVENFYLKPEHRLSSQQTNKKRKK